MARSPDGNFPKTSAATDVDQSKKQRYKINRVEQVIDKKGTGTFAGCPSLTATCSQARTQFIQWKCVIMHQLTFRSSYFRFLQSTWTRLCETNSSAHARTKEKVVHPQLTHLGNGPCRKEVYRGSVVGSFFETC